MSARTGAQEVEGTFQMTLFTRHMDGPMVWCVLRRRLENVHKPFQITFFRRRGDVSMGRCVPSRGKNDVLKTLFYDLGNVMAFYGTFSTRRPKTLRRFWTLCQPPKRGPFDTFSVSCISIMTAGGPWAFHYAVPLRRQVVLMKVQRK